MQHWDFAVGTLWPVAVAMRRPNWRMKSVTSTPSAPNVPPVAEMKQNDAIHEWGFSSSFIDHLKTNQIFLLLQCWSRSLLSVYRLRLIYLTVLFLGGKWVCIFKCCSLNDLIMSGGLFSSCPYLWYVCMVFTMTCATKNTKNITHFFDLEIINCTWWMWKASNLCFGCVYHGIRYFLLTYLYEITFCLISDFLKIWFDSFYVNFSTRTAV